MSTRQPASTQYVILAGPRTGSNFLLSALGQYDDITSLVALFNKPEIKMGAGAGLPDGLRDVLLAEDVLEQRDPDPIAFWHRLCDLTETPIVGFKFFPNHDERILDWALDNAQLKKIILRRNPLQSFTSISFAKRDGIWTSGGLQKKDVNTEKVELNIRQMLRWMAKYKAYFERVDEAVAEHDVLRISYNELFQPWSQQALVRFLGSNGEKPAKREDGLPRKIRSNFLQDKVANLDEVVDALRDSEYASMFLD